MDQENFKTKLDAFNKEIGIVISWHTDTQYKHSLNLCYEGRFGVDLILKTPQELMDEILLLPDSTLKLNAQICKSKYETGIKDYYIEFEFV